LKRGPGAGGDVPGDGVTVGQSGATYEQQTGKYGRGKSDALVVIWLPARYV